ncbi:MAG: folate-binding protein [Pseudomonadota bacterium]
MVAERVENRQVLEVSGADRVDFLQGLVTNDVAKLENGMVYAALLSPQGKYLADFFLIRQGDAILIDVASELATALLKRLTMYKLRADVVIKAVETPVARGLGAPPEGAFADPRHAALGWRSYGAPGSDPVTDWEALRVAHLIPETTHELKPDDSYILEMGFERLNGVDFKKGCYVGQEVTARMKHKTELRKGLAQVSLSGKADPGTPITSEGKPVGELMSVADGTALAYLRFDRAKGDMQAGAASLTLSQSED